MNPTTPERADAERDPLKGVRVVDFTIVMSGPLCTRTLADAGADVIKVEPPSGDMIRQRAPMQSGISTYFASLNCGKRSIVLDLATPEARTIALNLAATADVVVENFRPGVMKRLGLDYETLSARNPRLVYCSISGFGQTGPMADAPAYAPVIHAASGYEHAYMSYQASSDRPANNGIFIADVLGASQAASAIHLALYDRERTGRGQWIDVSLLDSVLGMLVWETQVAQHPTIRPRQVYQPVRAKDGFVMVAAVTPRNLDALFEVISYPEGKTDSRFRSIENKEANWTALLDIIERWTCQRPAAECEATMMRAGVPCSRYRTVGEVMQDPHIVERGTFERMGSDEESFLVANPPYKLSASRIKGRQRLPQLGEQTDEVLRDLLAFDDEQIEALRKNGAFGPAPRA